MPNPSHQVIIDLYERNLVEYGDSLLAVGWPKPDQAEVRYGVMLDVIRDRPAPGQTLLDFGSGAAHLYEYMLRHHLEQPAYHGLDMSPAYVELARRKFPERVFYQGDLLENPEVIPQFDYVVMNGILTQKCELTFDEMWDYARRLISRVFEKTRIGLAFNTMSKHLDWEREDLFHLPFDELARYLRSEVSRNYVFRADYGLFEYTTYVYR